MSDGNLIETGMVGRDGVMGALQAFDEKVSPNKIMIQVPGQASVIDAELMRKAISSSPSLRVMLAKHEQFFVAQIQQSAGCNATHSVEARMCRWLLRMYDLTGPELPLTQEFLAQMMGVRRTSVSLVASGLQDAGVIAYRRGHVRVANVEKLKKMACECYEAVNMRYKKIFQVEPPTHSVSTSNTPSAAISEMTTEKAVEPRQPRRFENRKNITVVSVPPRARDALHAAR